MYFEKCGSVQELKKEYRRLAMIFHPDRGGDTTIMAKINSEYKRMMDVLQHGGNSKSHYANNTQSKPKQKRKRTYYSESAIRNFWVRYSGSGGNVFKIDDETWIFYGRRLKTVIIKKVSWFNGTFSYTTRFYTSMPKKYQGILESAGALV